MMNRKPIIIAGIVVVSLAVAAVMTWQFGLVEVEQLVETSHSEHEENDGHDEHNEREERDSHDEHDDTGHLEHEKPEEGCESDDGHEEDGKSDKGKIVIRLSTAKQREFGVKLATAESGRLRETVKVPGEVVINADRVAHVVPRVSGVVREVKKGLGDAVGADEVMAFLESAELSEAKTQYLAKLNELRCCSADLTRAEALDASTQKLLKVLEKSPTLDQLQGMKLAAMDEGHSKLIAAYAEFVFAKAKYEREKKLVEQNISSRADFQIATNAYKKAFAELVAGRDGLAYQTQRSLLEARQSRKNMELELRAAAQKIRVMGVSSQEIQALKKTLQSGDAVGAEKEDCDDPNCTECEDHKATTRPVTTKTTSPVLGEQLGVYLLRAPFAGTVIDKHITLGEKLSNDAPVFTVADLSTVWVDLSIYQKDLPHVRKGQTVHIAFGKDTPLVEGKIVFVSSIVDSETRTAKARIILANPKGIYRPGLFVTADIDVSATSVPVLVPKSAVQRIEDRNVVFVPVKKGLAAQPVRLGQASRTHVEIVGGLHAGQKYVTKGAFQLKAQIITSGLDAHAGHGH